MCDESMGRGAGRVSVIIPTYNRARLVPRAIESVLAQTAVDRCEIVVVDDGSQDETRAVVGRYAPRVRYIYRQNGGLAAARNTGIRATDGEFIAFLDDDDEWLPEKIELQLAAFERWPRARFVAGLAMDRDARGNLSPRATTGVPLDELTDLAPALFVNNVLVMPTVVVRRSVLDRVGLFWEALRRVEDHHLWARVACHGPGVCLSQRLAVYAVSTPDGLSRNREAMLRSKRLVYEDLRRVLRRRPDCRRAWRRGMADCLARLRDTAYQRGRFAEAAWWGARCLAYEPQRAAWEWGMALRAIAHGILGGSAPVMARSAGVRAGGTCAPPPGAFKPEVARVIEIPEPTRSATGVREAAGRPDSAPVGAVCAAGESPEA